MARLGRSAPIRALVLRRPAEAPAGLTLDITDATGLTDSGQRDAIISGTANDGPLLTDSIERSIEFSVIDLVSSTDAVSTAFPIDVVLDVTDLTNFTDAVSLPAVPVVKFVRVHNNPATNFVKVAGTSNI